MSNSLIELLILAGVAAFVLYRLYSVFGQKTGAPPPQPRPTSQPSGDDIIPPRTMDPTEQQGDLDGLEAIRRAEPTFSSREFMVGARTAYEMIVNAYSNGDRAALRGLLSDEVFEAYDSAITQREESGQAALEFLRLKQAKLEDGDLDGSVARITVFFEAELGDDERTRTTKESWTFERDLNTGDPNWRLSDVYTAT